MLQRLSKKFKGKENAARNFVIGMSIIPFIFIGYGIYLVFSSALGGGAESQQGIMAWIENILFIYGILSLLISLYLKPLIIEEFDKAAELGKLNFWKKRLVKTGRSLKKRCFGLMAKEICNKHAISSRYRIFGVYSDTFYLYYVLD